MSRKKTVDLETVAGHFQSLVSIIMSAVRAGYVPYEVVRWLTTDVGRCILLGLLVKARNEYVELHGIKPDGPEDVYLQDGKKVSCTLARVPDYVKTSGDAIVEWAGQIQVRTHPHGFALASKTQALAFVGDKTCDLCVIEWVNDAWVFRRLIVVEGQVAINEVVTERLVKEVPVLLVANQSPALREPDGPFSD